MPSEVVHVAVAGLLGASLLAEKFDGRAILVVMGATIVPDFDAFIAFWVQGGHRAVLHTLLLPALLTGIVVYDTSIRDRSYIRERWGDYGQRVAWVSLLAMVVAGIGPDLFGAGVNLFYPIHDQFYSFSAKITVTNKEGLIVNFLKEVEGTTKTAHYSTGFDPTRGAAPPDVERVFDIFDGRWEFLLGVSSYLIVIFRVWETRKE